MSAVPELTDELADLGKAIGLLNAAGGLDGSWFNTPVDKLRTMLSDSDQREALLGLLDALLPPNAPAGVPVNEKWHPLLGSQPRGNVYLTVLEESGGVTVGVAGHYGSPAIGGNITAEITGTLPLVKAGATVDAIAGSATGPLDLHLRVNLGWTRPADPIGLKAMRFDVGISTLGVAFSLTLEQLQLDDSAPRDVVLDPENLGEESLQLVLGLVKRMLQEVLVAAGPEANAVKDHLLSLLGLADDGILPLPLAELGRNPAALQDWFDAMLDEVGPPPIMAWLGHLAGLLGAPGVLTLGTGTEADPWRVVFVPFAAGEGLAVTVCKKNGRLCFGILAAVVPGVAGNPRIQAAATLAEIPLSGTARARVLPNAAITLNVPGSGATPLIDTPALAVQALAAGVAWDGAALKPKLELQTVRFNTTPYDKIDLTNTDSVAQAATGVVQAALDAALGPGVGRHLAALIGIIPPAGDSTSAHHADLAQLFSNPARAIGSFHRDVLLDATHNWSFMLQEIAALVGLSGPVNGAGTDSDPWRVDIAATGPVTISLAAWNAASGGDAKLRLGLVARAGTGNMTVQWLAEILAFDLPADGTGQVNLLAGQHLTLRIAPGPSYTSPDGLAFSAASIDARADWTPGANLTWQVGLTGLAVTADGTTITVPNLKFPASFDAGNPSATAASLGISLAELEALFKQLIGRAAGSWGGLPGYVVGALMGAHGRLQGLQDDWPTLVDPAGPGTLFSDPGAALRAWLEQLVSNVSADGSPFLPRLLPWLQTLIDGGLDETAAPDFSGLPPVAGDGTYDLPWVLPLGSGNRAPQALAWLEPAGPPSNWAAALAIAANGAIHLADLTPTLRALAGFSESLGAAINGLSDTTLAGSLGQLAQHLSSSDGVVPLSAQTPVGANWQAGAVVDAAHHLAPANPSAITQILTQVDAWAATQGGARCVLYLGPSFADRTAWDNLLASPARNGTVDPDANFALREPSVDPLTISLDGVTAKVDHYTAELFDDASGDQSKAVAQIARIVDRLGILRPGVKVTLVAHSTAGLAARLYTAANAGKVQGLITLATPHLGAPLNFLTSDAVGAAIRVAQGLLASMPASTLKSALEHLVVALDGYTPPSAPGLLPTAAPYPVASFLGTAATDTGGVPALAIPSQLAGSLQSALNSAAAVMATNAAAGARPLPTHLCFGVAAALDMAVPQANQIAVDTRLRANLVRIKLRSGVADPPRPAQSLRVSLAIERPGGWLVGGPGPSGASDDPLRDVRIRRALLAVDATLDGDKLKVTPFANLVQSGYRGQLADVRSLADALSGPLLGALMRTLSLPAPAADSPAGALLTALQALGLAVPDPAGGFGFAADALSALQNDAVSFLEPKLRAAMDSASGLAGLAGPVGGPWQFALPDLPLSLTLQKDPWRISLATTGDGLALGGAAKLSFAAALSLPALAGTLDATFRIGQLALTYAQATGELTVAADPWLSALRLYPAPAPSDLITHLNDALPRLLFSSAAGTLMEALLGPDVQLGPLDSFFSATGAFLQNPQSLGSSGGGFDGAKVNALLEAIGNLAGLGAGPGLALPGDLRLTASGAGTDASPLTIQLATAAPIAGILGIALTASIDRLRHLSPGGSLSLAIPLGGTWPQVTADFHVDAAGVALSVTPQGQPPIQLLPTFSGLGALRGAAVALLPQVLDELVNALSTPGPAPAWLNPILSVASALDLYDNAGKFTAHANDLQALVQGNLASLLDSTHRANAANALASLLNGLGLPGTVSASGAAVTWSFAAGGGQVGVSAGWDGAGPLVRIFVTDMKPADGPVRLTASAGYAAGTVVCEIDAGLSLASSLHIAVEPRLSVGIDTGGGFSLKLYPLAVGGSVLGPLEIVIAPTPAINAAIDSPAEFVTEVALPLAIQAAYVAAKPQLSQALWTAGPTLRDTLTYAHLIDGSDNLQLPLPDILDIVTGLVSGIAGNLSIAKIDITPNLHLKLAAENNQVGLKLYGQQDFDAGDYKLSLRFGAPSNWSPTPGPGRGKADDGIVLWLFDTSSGIAIKPELLVAGLGFGISGHDKPLIDTSYLRVGGLVGYFFFDLETMPNLSLNSFGAGIDMVQFGIPLGMATGGNLGGNNPVAANLLKSDGGSGSHPGDTQPVNPAADVEFWYWDAPKGDAQLHVRVGGETGAIWIGVHAGFGPIYIDQVGIKFDDKSAGMLIDGGVSVAGFTAQVDDLTVLVPYRDAGDPSKWTLDLKGLAIGYSNAAVSIAGGLVKFDGPPVEYDGMLLIKVSQIGIVAVGAYSTPTEAGGEQYTSVAIFAGVFVPIGITPIIKISALGLGVGYNRQILVPSDLNTIPDFALVKALDRPEDFANDPMGTLRDFRQQFPARRGSLWLAVGLRGTSFEIVNVTAVLYIALDRGVEVGLLGVARMALPADDAAIVSVELALKVRFSSAEGLFSIQAQLTDNSWLLSHDCQLTGGFAYFMWFTKSQFLLTLGGYHPAFKPLPEYPVVARLGYHWDLLGVVHLKGESYFALTNTCIMAGTRMEATYGPDWLQLWFTAYADILVSWDPFYYDISVGISVGARLRIEICFFACATISISISVGATLRLQGPPLHGTATVDLGVCSVTVPFGPEPRQDDAYLPWPAFRDKYLLNGDPSGNAFQGHVTEGLLPPDPPGGEIAPGTADAPWKIAAEWGFQTGSNMPAKGFVFQDETPRNEGDLPTNGIGKFEHLSEVYDFDIAPMGKGAHDVSALHRVVIEKWDAATGTASGVSLDPDRIKVEPIYGQVSEATYHYFGTNPPPAAANTLPALVGLNFLGFAESCNESKPIDIRHLVDESNSRPLPFATLDVVLIGELIAFGQAANSMAVLTGKADTGLIIHAAGQILQGPSGVFADARVNAGLPREGLHPLAANALAKRRSAPPLVTPLSTGLTLEPVGQPLPPPIVKAPEATPVFLESPRLRAVMMAKSVPTSVTVSLRTTVSGVLRSKIKGAAAAAAIPRMAPPRPAPILGAELRRVPEAHAPRPTAHATAGRTLLNAQLGNTLSPAHQVDFATAEKAIIGEGVAVPAGTTHLWDVPPGASRILVLEGTAAARVSILSRSGHVLDDIEYVVAHGRKIELPAACAMLAVTCLGEIPDAARSPMASQPGGPAAASFGFARAGAPPIVGWQSSSEVQQITPTTFLARGATLELTSRTRTQKRGQPAGHGVTKLSTLLAGQVAVSTRLPGRASVLAIALDVVDTCADDDGDLAIAVDGLTPSSNPLLVLGGRRKIWLYDLVADKDRPRPEVFTVAVASKTGSRPAGVMAMGGTAQEWAVRLNGQVPPNLVADGPITPYGQVQVKLMLRQADAAGARK